MLFWQIIDYFPIATCYFPKYQALDDKKKITGIDDQGHTYVYHTINIHFNHHCINSKMDILDRTWGIRPPNLIFEFFWIILNFMVLAKSVLTYLCTSDNPFYTNSFFINHFIPFKSWLIITYITNKNVYMSNCIVQVQNYRLVFRCDLWTIIEWAFFNYDMWQNK